MTIVDSSVWVAYFNSAPSLHARRLDDVLREEEDVAVIPLIITEVLQGFRSESGFRRARRALVSLPVIHPTLDCHVKAASLFRALRRRGVTIRGSIDCVIAQTCLDLQAELLSSDADFERIALHTSLRLWRL